MIYSVYHRKSGRLVCRLIGQENSWEIHDNDMLKKSFDGSQLIESLPSFGDRLLIKDESVEMQADPLVSMSSMVSSEMISDRVEPALTILKEILERAAKKKKERAEIEAHKQAVELERQNAEVVMEQEGQYYVTMDGDGIGNQVARAQYTDDEAKVKEVSRRIESGKDLFVNWAVSMGGVIIEVGGDEGQVRVSSTALEHIEEFRNGYFKQVGATVTVGVGKTISQSIQARELGKLRGKNQVVYWEENTEKELNLRIQQKGKESPEKKLVESGVLGGPSAPAKEQPKLGENPRAPSRPLPKFAVPDGTFEANQKTQQEYEEWLRSQKKELAS